jgi:hypothetical protein
MLYLWQMQLTETRFTCGTISAMGNPKYSDRMLSQCHVIQYESQIDYPRPQYEPPN